MSKEPVAFRHMRAHLLRRGLLAQHGDGYRPTSDGHAHVETLKAALRRPRREASPCQR